MDGPSCIGTAMSRPLRSDRIGTRHRSEHDHRSSVAGVGVVVERRPGAAIVVDPVPSVPLATERDPPDTGLGEGRHPWGDTGRDGDVRGVLREFVPTDRTRVGGIQSCHGRVRVSFEQKCSAEHRWRHRGVSVVPPDDRLAGTTVVGPASGGNGDSRELQAFCYLVASCRFSNAIWVEVRRFFGSMWLVIRQYPLCAVRVDTVE